MLSDLNSTIDITRFSVVRKQNDIVVIVSGSLKNCPDEAGAYLAFSTLK